MGAKDYQELIHKNPRPYDVVILWNVPSDFANCEHCTQVEKEFYSVAYSFVNSRGADVSIDEKKIFFVIVPFLGRDKNVQSIYKDNNFLTVPYLTVSPLDLKRDPNDKDIFKTEEKWLIGANEVFDANKQIEFVNNILRTDVKIKFTFMSILIKNFMVFCIIGVIF